MHCARNSKPIKWLEVGVAGGIFLGLLILTLTYNLVFPPPPTVEEEPNYGVQGWFDEHQGLSPHDRDLMVTALRNYYQRYPSEVLNHKEIWDTMNTLYYGLSVQDLND